MIITLKQININRFPEISVSEAPERIFLELVTEINKTGIRFIINTPISEVIEENVKAIENFSFDKYLTTSPTYEISI